MGNRPRRYLVTTVHTPYGSNSTVHLQFYTFYAEHPDIAYELSMQFGRETCFGRRFEGLGHLGPTDRRVIRTWKSESGIPDEFVVDKEELEAFAKPHWSGAPCDEALFQRRTSEPPFRMGLDELDGTPWYQFEHAYGSAFDVPKELRRLTSIDPTVQKRAIERLYGTIYHQGSIYPATVPAVFPLLHVVANPHITNRAGIAQLFKDITKSAVVAPAAILAKWEKLAALSFAPVQKPDEEADREIAERRSVRDEICSHLRVISDLAIDRDLSVAVEFQKVVELLSHS